jgi:hypothetical protein
MFFRSAEQRIIAFQQELEQRSKVEIAQEVERFKQASLIITTITTTTIIITIIIFIIGQVEITRMRLEVQSEMSREYEARMREAATQVADLIFVGCVSGGGVGGGMFRVVVFVITLYYN